MSVSEVFGHVRVRTRVQSHDSVHVRVRVWFGYGLGHELMSEVVSVSEVMTLSESMSESVSEADSGMDTRFFGTLDTDMGRVLTSDTDTTSDTGMSENLGHGHTSDTRVRSSVIVTK